MSRHKVLLSPAAIENGPLGVRFRFRPEGLVSPLALLGSLRRRVLREA